MNGNSYWVGNRIRSLRKSARLTQSELGDRLNVTGQAVAHWERGRSLPSITDLPELAGALGVSIAGFYGEAEPAKPQDAPLPRIEIRGASGERYTIESIVIGIQ